MVLQFHGDFFFYCKHLLILMIYEFCGGAMIDLSENNFTKSLKCTELNATSQNSTFYIFLYVVINVL